MSCNKVGNQLMDSLCKSKLVKLRCIILEDDLHNNLAFSKGEMLTFPCGETTPLNTTLPGQA